jgi:tripartite-type tricarboxylate transporter receptor subunit TctC
MVGRSDLVSHSSSRTDPGAATNIATEAAVRAPANGYTLLLVTASNAINATLHDNLGFNFTRYIMPVGSIGRVSNVHVDTSILSNQDTS